MSSALASCVAVDGRFATSSRPPRQPEGAQGIARRPLYGSLGEAASG